MLTTSLAVDDVAKAAPGVAFESHELQLLHRSVERSFPEPDDRTLAEVGDSQGVGGTYGGPFGESS